MSMTCSPSQVRALEEFQDVRFGDVDRFLAVMTLDEQSPVAAELETLLVAHALI